MSVKYLDEKVATQRWLAGDNLHETLAPKFILGKRAKRIMNSWSKNCNKDKAKHGRSYSTRSTKHSVKKSTNKLNRKRNADFGTGKGGYRHSNKFATDMCWNVS